VIDKAFGDFVRRKRRLLDLTLECVAKQLGIDKGRLSKIEHGLIRPPAGEFLAIIANTLDIRPGTKEHNELKKLYLQNRIQIARLDLGPESVNRRKYVRCKENPREILPIGEAFAKLRNWVEEDGTTIEKAELYFRCANGREYAADVEPPMIDSSKKKQVKIIKVPTRKQD
jgi:transcriptional regulator with XRE-family HTH domain